MDYTQAKWAQEIVLHGEADRIYVDRVYPVVFAVSRLDFAQYAERLWQILGHFQRYNLRLIDLTGKKYGRLTVLDRAPNRNKCTMWRCECECGNTVVVSGSHLKNGHTKSCGCLLAEIVSNMFSTHRDTKSALYRMWHNMRVRCNYERSDRYSTYGARGIKVCDEWNSSYEIFRRWALEHGYKEGLSIERKNVNDGYAPDNCEFIPVDLQCYNKTNSHYLEYDGRRMTVSEWSKISGISYQTLRARVSRYGWTVEKALTTPVRGRKGEEYGIG